MVALLAGAAGMLSLVSAKSAALVGCSFRSPTVPAAGFAVVAASVGDWDIAAESAAQLAVNLVGITLAGVLVLAVRRRHARRPGMGCAAPELTWPCAGHLVVVGLRPMGIKVALEHRTSYTFDRLVEVHPHVVRLRPAPHSRTPIEAYSLEVEPADHFVNWQQDAFGNFLARLVFPSRTRNLTIKVGLIADMKVINPFDFFIEDYAETFLFSYPKALREDLEPYLRPVDEGRRVPAPASW